MAANQNGKQGYQTERGVAKGIQWAQNVNHNGESHNSTTPETVKETNSKHVNRNITMDAENSGQ